MMALLTNEEYTALFLTLHQQESTDVYDALIDDREDANDLPTEVDWTAQGAVTPVKN